MPYHALDFPLACCTLYRPRYSIVSYLRLYQAVDEPDHNRVLLYLVRRPATVADIELDFRGSTRSNVERFRHPVTDHLYRLKGNREGRGGNHVRKGSGRGGGGDGVMVVVVLGVAVVVVVVIGMAWWW